MPAILPDQKDVVYRAARFEVYRLELPRRGGGEPVTREVVRPRDAVVVVPMLDEETVVLIRNNRFAVGQTLWEVPAGTIEPGEDPRTCADRELIEETGYEADEITPLTEWFPTPGFCTEYQYVYLATGLTEVGQDLDETEQIEVHPTAMGEAIAMVRDGTIRDAKTIAALLFVGATQD